MKKKVGLGLLLAVLACSVCASAFGAAARMRPYTSAATIRSAKKQTERTQKRILSVVFIHGNFDLGSDKDRL